VAAGAFSDRETAIGPGCVVLAVGPSGAGKDALLSAARSQLVGDLAIVFVERVISRPPHAAEAHASLSTAESLAAASQGAYALTWRAHDLHYGIPASIDGDINHGKAVVFNASRSIVADARWRYARVHVILIDCPIEVRAHRLALRGRESLEQIRVRLERITAGFDPTSADAYIDNSGPLECGAAELVSNLRSVSLPPV
jgi:ribose 1,5-bisphosphokinase